MFSIIVILLILLSCFVMSVSWYFFHKHKRKIINILIFPYALYFFFMLIGGRDQINTYINSQLFTGLLAFYAVYSMLLLILLGQMTDKEK